MKTINKDRVFSLLDFCKRQGNKIQIYGEETLDEDGNIIPFVDQAALITHYLQLRNADVPFGDITKESN